MPKSITLWTFERILQDAFSYWRDINHLDKQYAVFPDEDLLDELGLMSDNVKRDLVRDILVKFVNDLNTDLENYPLLNIVGGGAYTKVTVGNRDLVMFT